MRYETYKYERRVKKKVAKFALKFIDDDIVLGLGTGSTVRYFLYELSKYIREKGLRIKCIPSSIDTELIARKLGIPIDNFLQEIDITIDGADKVDENLNLIKGGGGALLREKLLAKSSKEVIIIVDESKLYKKLSGIIPVEIVPFSLNYVLKELSKYGNPSLRYSKSRYGPEITDNNNFIIDLEVGEIENPKELELELKKITGVVESGIFPNDLVSKVLIGKKDKVEIIER